LQKCSAISFEDMRIPEAGERGCRNFCLFTHTYNTHTLTGYYGKVTNQKNQERKKGKKGRRGSAGFF
jgi:hypothetical protein